MTRLPLVKKEIAYSMKANIETRKSGEMEEMENPTHQGFFLQGVCFVYMSLQSQLEANEFKEKWDMDGDVPF